MTRTSSNLTDDPVLSASQAARGMTHGHRDPRVVAADVCPNEHEMDCPREILQQPMVLHGFTTKIHRVGTVGL